MTDKPELFHWVCPVCGDTGTATSKKSADLALDLHIAVAHPEYER